MRLALFVSLPKLRAFSIILAIEPAEEELEEEQAQQVSNKGGSFGFARRSNGEMNAELVRRVQADDRRGVRL